MLSLIQVDTVVGRINEEQQLTTLMKDKDNVVLNKANNMVMIATWNVRGAYKEGVLKNLTQKQSKKEFSNRNRRLCNV